MDNETVAEAFGLALIMACAERHHANVMVNPITRHLKIVFLDPNDAARFLQEMEELGAPSPHEIGITSNESIH